MSEDNNERIKKKPKLVENLLDDISQQMQETNKQRRKSELLGGQRSSSNLDTVVHQLLEVTRLRRELITKNLLNTKIEVELRIGDSKLFVTGGFPSGIEKGVFEVICKLLEENEEISNQFTMMQMISDTEYHYDGHIRVQYDEEQKKIIKAERKERFSNFDFAIQANGMKDYLLRLSISSETPGQVDPILNDNWILKRTKTRYSFKSKELPFQIDMTAVKTIVRTGEVAAPVDTTFEMEIEFSDEFVKSCEEGDRRRILEVLSDVWVQIQDIFKHLYEYMKGNIHVGIGSREAHTFAEILMVKETDRAELKILREACNEWMPKIESNNTDFPGSMPVNFSRRQFPIIQSNSYYVSEKTDGIRYLLMISKDKGVYLIDRKYDFYLVHGCDILMDLFAKKGITILDGEMVRHARSNQVMFLIFDVIVIEDSPFISKPLSQRLAAISKEVVGPFRKAMEDPQSSTTFILIGKTFYPKSQIKTLVFDKIKKEKSPSKERYYEDDKRFHKTDGIIFTPDDIYYAKTCPLLFKWKYVDKLSVDFKVTYSPNRNKFIFSCCGYEGQDIEYNVHLKENDLNKVKRDLYRHINVNSDSNTNNFAILECSYNPLIGEWTYMTLRSDKNKANHIKVVFDTLEVIAENVSIEEIAYRTLIDIKKEQDDWIKQLEQTYRAMAQRQHQSRPLITNGVQQHPPPSEVSLPKQNSKNL